MKGNCKNRGPPAQDGSPPRSRRGQGGGWPKRQSGSGGASSSPPRKSDLPSRAWGARPFLGDLLCATGWGLQPRRRRRPVPCARGRQEAAETRCRRRPCAYRRRAWERSHFCRITFHAGAAWHASQRVLFLLEKNGILKKMHWGVLLGPCVERIFVFFRATLHSGSLVIC